MLLERSMRSHGMYRRMTVIGVHTTVAYRKILSSTCAGYYWMASKDGSIQPNASCADSQQTTCFSNAFPVELVSRRMRFSECDVVMFCDMVRLAMHQLCRPDRCRGRSMSCGASPSRR